MQQLNQHIEALIFCSEQSISLDEIAASLKISFGWEPTEEELLQAIESIRVRYEAEEFAFELSEISGGYQFLTKKEFHPTISALIQHKAKKKLSVAQMETLAIIAYKQPITKSETEHIRGVNCDYAIQKLLEKELIEMSGKSDGPGRPVLYRTSRNFMDYFGIRSAKDLPQLKDIRIEQNEIGTAESPEEVSESVMEVVHSDVENMPSEEPMISSEVTAEEPVALVNDEHLADTGENILEITAELTELSDEMPPVEGSEEDLQLPDRKTIFLANNTEPENMTEPEELRNPDREEEQD